MVSGIYSSSARTLDASHARRAAPARDQMAGSSTKSSVVVPSSSAARSAGLSRTRRSRLNHITEEVAEDMPLNVAGGDHHHVHPTSKNAAAEDEGARETCDLARTRKGSVTSWT